MSRHLQAAALSGLPLARGLYLLSWLNLLATAVLLAAWASFGGDWPLRLLEILGAGQ